MSENNKLNDSVKSLAEVEEGRQVIFVAFEGGFGARKRIADMGLTSGERFALIAKREKGPYIILLKGSRVAIGRGMAEKIIIR